VAEGNRTLWVAVAGIAATALVGLAGTTAAWLSARDDRAAQRVLARDDRTYDRRVSAYLDAIGYLERQNLFWQDIFDESPPTPDLTPTKQQWPRRLRIYLRKFSTTNGNWILYQPAPATPLEARLRAFGSLQALKAFQAAHSAAGSVPKWSYDYGGRIYIRRSDYWTIDYDKEASSVSMDHESRFTDALDAFQRSLRHFERIVHDEVG
jgi:hypothetical protein